jgi:adenosylcobinamide-phosphate synthase
MAVSQLLPGADLPRGLSAAILVGAACLIDRILGDPHGWPHPVQAMGALIAWLRRPAEAWAGDRPAPLRLAGTLLALLVLAASALAGWSIERLALALPPLGLPLLLAAMASALAGRSLELAVLDVLDALAPGMAAAAASSAGPSPLEPARRRLAWIVGRDVDHLGEPEILRALAETASENGVDGLFAPLFWMLLGAALWALLPAQALPLCPGPLTMAWMFKAASTMDSMLGYRRGRLRWLGTAGARLDDLLTWLPCRLVALSLAIPQPPAFSPGAGKGPCWRFRQALREGAADPSPNAGVSQAAYGLAAGVRLGGVNRYGGELRSKPVLVAAAPAADRGAVLRILAINNGLELLWLILSTALLLLLSGTG